MFAISPTDNNWFYFNKSLSQSNSINFWTPTPWNVRRLKPGDRLYFMLKSPIRLIGGFGIFREYENNTIPTAWNKYGLGNGVNSKSELINRLNKYLAKHTSKDAGLKSHEIGCIVLDECEFWEDDQFIDIDSTTHDFKRNIVKIKYYDEYDNIRSNFKSLVRDSGEFEMVTNEKKQKKRSNQTVRIGQSEFRTKLIRAYQAKCCVTGDKCEELLEAAHIQPYLNRESNHIQNGLLLRVDFHKLFDKGLFNIDNQYRVRISRLIKSSYYQSFDSKMISLPSNENFHPSKVALVDRAKNFREI